MKLENSLSKEYNERQAKIVNYKMQNLEKLNRNLYAVCNASAIAYAEFGDMPTSITMLNQEDYNTVARLCINNKLLLEYSKYYINDMHSDIDDYFKPYDYQKHIESIMSESIDNRIRKSIADNVASVDVPKEDLLTGSNYSYIVHKDLFALQEELHSNFQCTKSFKSIK